MYVNFCLSFLNKLNFSFIKSFLVSIPDYCARNDVFRYRYRSWRWCCLLYISTHCSIFSTIFDSIGKYLWHWALQRYKALQRRMNMNWKFFLILKIFNSKIVSKAEEFDGIKIVRIQQELHATNAAVFKKTVYELTKVKPQFYLALKNKQEARKKRQEDANKPSALSKVYTIYISNKTKNQTNNLII